MSDTKFVDCKLQEVEFSYSDLSKALFDSSDLTRAIFYSTNLEKANFKSAHNFSIEPSENKMTGAIFSKEELTGLLQKHKLKIVP